MPQAPPLSQPLAALTYHAKTMYLFTASDLKTTLLPVTLFAVVAGPVMSWTAFFGSVAWTWLHLLQFNLSNQLKGVDEDIRNKPYRPLAAGRMSLETAEVFRWRLWWFCVAISGFGGWPLVAASLGFLITGYVYDETILSAHWIGKSIGGVSGYSTLEAGAALVIRGASDFDIVALLSFGLFAAILLTTLHAQDFADRVGDAAIGRVTFPILFPEASRIFTFASVLAWSYGLTRVWNIGPISSLIFGALGLLVAGRYYRYRTVEADTQTFVAYNMWLMAVMVLPARARWGWMSV